MAEQTYTTMPFDNSEGKTALIVYSKTGAKTQADFDTAYNQWQQGKVPQGYEFITSDSVNKARELFYKVSGPVQQGAKAVDEGLLKLRNIIGEKTGAYDPTSYGIKPAQTITSMIDTPEMALMNTATLGRSKWVNAAGSPILQGVRQAATAGAGYAAGMGAFGGYEGKGVGQVISEPLLAAAVSGATQTGMGLLKSVFGVGVSQQAQKEVFDGITDAVRKKVGNISHDPVAMEAYLSTPQGFSEALQIGAGALRGDVERSVAGTIQQLKVSPGPLPATSARNVTANIVNSLGTSKNVNVPGGPLSGEALTAEFIQGAPRALTTHSRQALQSYIKQIGSKTNDLLNAKGDPGKYVEIKLEMNELASKATQLIKDEFVKASDPVKKMQIARLNGILDKYNQDINKYTEVVDVFKLMKEAGFEKGINAETIVNFQRLVQGQFAVAGPQSLMHAVGKSAFRGADPTKGGDTLGMEARLNIAKMLGLDTIPALKHLGINIPTGNKYVGSIPGTYPRGTAATGAVFNSNTISTIKDYLDAGKSR